MNKTLLISALLLITLPALANPLLDNRYVSEIKRDANGQIVRRADVIRAFKKIHPCPSSGKTTGACEGFSIDHVIPLSCYGIDGVSNMQWLPNIIKSSAGTIPKDRFERKIYAVGKGTQSCKNEIVIVKE